MTPRRKKLAIIHIAKKELGLDDETYRALLWGACRLSSAKDLQTEAQYQRIMKAFRQAGYQSPLPGAGKVRDPQLAKCYALWCELHKWGAIKQKKYTTMMSWAYTRLGGRQDILRGDQKALLIEELKAWIARVKEEA